ncbi:7591_t:CDS:2 [Acaulospora morrowiae]|uniref:glucan endo-1,3-beta-D-glucosidase n=1 Tax=Acaulospora morrowiae TaxID=94023 RepID=A0A9N9EEJ3_9GLOM|nr:7591_t:CDS:2 [Acaulospora morrowiae]
MDTDEKLWRRLSSASKDAESNEWLLKQQQKARRQKIIIATIGLAILGAIVAVIVLHYLHPNSPIYPTGSGSNGGNSTDNGNSPSSGNPSKSNNNTIIPDKSLIHSFYGIGYTPLNTQFPSCGATLANITEDIKILSQLTSRIRLYGQDCQQADMVLQAIRNLKVNMSVILTIWVDSNMTTYKRQYDSFFNTLKTYGADGNIDSVSVGNEVLFRKEISSSDLFARMADVRSKVKAMGFKDIKVSTSDLGSNYDSSMIKASDTLLANIHPFFAGVPAEQGSNWTFKYFNDNIVVPGMGKPAIISEVGWPTQNGTLNASIASVPNLQTFMDDFVCEANRRKVPYYFFEAYDEPWKIITGSEMECHWGLMTVNRELKVKIPNCPID